MMVKRNHSGDLTRDNLPRWSSCIKADVAKGKGKEAVVQMQDNTDLSHFLLCEERRLLQRDGCRMLRGLFGELSFM